MTAHRGTAGAVARARVAVDGAGRRALAVALAVAAVVAGPLLAAQDRLLLGSCTTPGHVGPLAMRLALLQASPDCPAGTVGLGPAGRGAVVLASVALPVLLAHLALVVIGGSLAALLARLARGIRGVLRARLVPPVGRVRLVPVRAAGPVVGRRRVSHGRAAFDALPTRGPPVSA
ncbi:hypothetical protein [Cellulomonas alba]|uniref:RDD domain-containing protein n=1 Tax=Cellulomonas alba TaxID=3053467 RepID=A0ABT7SGV7_9CELL|nr:hypothetical protein [Cellulomonas alba]MDM7855408.1 hypothetical protein [Cellulomonas alba]